MKLLCRLGLHKLRPAFRDVPDTPTSELIMKCKHCPAEFPLKKPSRRKLRRMLRDWEERKGSIKITPKMIEEAERIMDEIRQEEPMGRKAPNPPPPILAAEKWHNPRPPGIKRPPPPPTPPPPQGTTITVIVKGDSV